jgi:hypothetical protein
VRQSPECTRQRFAARSPVEVVEAAPSNVPTFAVTSAQPQAGSKGAEPDRVAKQDLKGWQRARCIARFATPRFTGATR